MNQRPPTPSLFPIFEWDVDNTYSISALLLYAACMCTSLVYRRTGQEELYLRRRTEKKPQKNVPKELHPHLNMT